LPGRLERSLFPFCCFVPGRFSPRLPFAQFFGVNMRGVY
jgi:hypothetical protein